MTETGSGISSSLRTTSYGRSLRSGLWLWLRL
eukprot:COSAG04_NODE_2124_length_4748_cov_2.919122_1_plen_31_part_10